jgi:hypothetical protein
VLPSAEMARRTPWLTLTLVVMSTLGCSRVREIGACREVVREVNVALDEIEKLTTKSPVDELRIARRYGELATALAPHARGESALATAVREYVAVLQGTQAAVQAHAAAASSHGRVGEARRELDKLTKRERAAASRLDIECHS